MTSVSRRIEKEDPTRLVARFLLSNGYLDTLQAFSDECNIQIADMRLDDDEGEQVTLESLLEERRLRELSIKLAEARLAESEIPGWSTECPQEAISLPLKTPTNVLFVAASEVMGGWSILVATADRALRIYDYETRELKYDFTSLHASPILEARVLRQRWLLTAGMDGKTVVTDLVTKEVKIASLPEAHSKYVNRLVIHEDRWLATSGYDKKISLYEITTCTDDVLEIEFRASMQLATLPEGMLFALHEDQVVLVVCARDTCFLEYFRVPDLMSVLRLNMNQNKDLWVSFSGIDITQQPTGPRFIGLSTSTTPYGRWLAFDVGSEELKANIFHGAPQSDLGVLPRHVWRPDGSGFWVNSDDGLIRGVEVKSGKVMKTLRGHDSAVRTLWTGMIGGKEVLISGSFDKSVLIFR